ncbi:MAG TPA: hypothetical protein VFW33_17640 [Gemmataceae bacterium]|nr:hypothetical protein [Gemmataceae bacterium]
MKADRDCAYRPGLESLEDRCLLTGTTVFRPVLPAPINVATFFAPLRNPGAYTHTAAQVPTLLHPAAPTTYKTTIVPQHMTSLGAFTSPPQTTINGIGGGITTPGLRTPSVLAGDQGFTFPGLPSFAPSQPVTAPPLQPTGFTITPQGIISGSLF